MLHEELISVETFCTSYNVEFAFISQLQEFGLVELTTQEHSTFIPESALKKVEQITRLHNDLDINVEGLEVITHLLERIKDQQQEILHLRNRLDLYETNNG